MDSPLFQPTHAIIKDEPVPEVLTGPVPASLELMPRADGAERFATIVLKIDDHEALAMSLAILPNDSPETIGAKAAQARRLRLDVFRPLRVSADKLHADLKAGVLEIGRKLDKARADIRARCEKVEDHLQAIETELKRREQLAADQRQDARLKEIAPYRIGHLPLPEWPDDDKAFAAILAEQQAAHAGWVAHQEAERRAKEEAERKAEEERKAAAEQRRKELEDAKKAKAEADAKLEAERKAAAEQRRKDEAARETERKQQQAELERVRKEQEAELAKEREERRKEQEAAAEAERKRIAEDNERKRQEKIREQLRQAAMAKLEQAARQLAAALADAQPMLSGDVAAGAAAALAVWSEIEPAL